MDTRIKGKKLTASITAGVGILSVGIAGISSIVVWGQSVNGSATASQSSSSSSSDSFESHSRNDDSTVTQGSGTSPQATSSGS